ncbi:hypothetical protein LZ518_01845 [Sphingomonas sp. RB56-2]|uniref:Uncharacterized protein n=1 Tax=Sphingomonas brevis TaxID=2908206 RepID=A0ABT0S6Z1_9SPHN|nr:hypothetical protein [Sphingomonas brevis]MCL6739882.1 hypothetical protein [Sphingomonas brevis]
MPTANQYSLSHRELTEIIIKHADVHEGKWMLMATFGFNAGNFGPSENDVLPGAVVAIQQLGIQRAEAGAPAGMIVDAAEVNPKKK